MILAGIGGGSEAGGAGSVVEAIGGDGVVGDEDGEAVAHAFAVGPLSAAARGDGVVAVLVVDDSAVGGIGVGGVGGAEVEGGAVIPGVAGAVAGGEHDVDGEAGLAGDGGISWVPGEDEVTDLVGLDVGVDGGALGLASVGGVVDEIGGSWGRDGLGKLRGAINEEVMAGAGCEDGHGGRAAVGDGEVAAGIGIGRGAARDADGGPGHGG